MGNASKIVTKARAGLILDQPFFGSLALRLELKEDPGCGTAWTDGRFIGYDPEFIESLSLDEVKGLLCHEVMHCANQHTTRRNGRDAGKWDTACDYAIDPLILKVGMTLPMGGHVDSSVTDMSAEKIYTLVPDSDDGDGDEKSGGSGKGPSGQDDPGNFGEVRDAKSEDDQAISPDQAKKLEQEWKIATAQAATQAKARGELPGDLERMVKEINDPELDWRELLRRFVDTAAKNDYSWSPPNRRFIHQGLILPSLRSNELGKIAVAIDTSGSISQSDLDKFAGELTGILGEFEAECEVIYCDSAVQAVEEFGPWDLPLQLHAKGGGGTDFIPPFKHEDESRELPACFIYMTDGWCNSFPDEPSYPVLWVLTNDREWKPPFGEVAHL